MDWSAPAAPTFSMKRPLDHSDDDPVAKFVPPTFNLTKTIAECAKIDIAEKKGLSNISIILSSSDGSMPKFKATELRKELNSKISQHKDLEEIELTRNGNIIFHAKTAACQKQILKISTLGGKQVFSRVLNEMISVQYVIHDVDPEISLKEIGDELDYSGVDWFQLVRFTKNVGGKRVPIPTLLVKEFGSVTPEKLKLWYIRHRVSKYVEKPKICFKCLKFGHTKVACRGKLTCSKCSGEHELRDCKNCDIICFRCQGSHLATDRNCPHYILETEILKVKSERRISYRQARKYINDSQNTYAKIANVKVGNSDTVNDKVLRHIEELSTKVEYLTQILFKSDFTKCFGIIKEKPFLKVDNINNAADGESLPKKHPRKSESLKEAKISVLPSTSKAIEFEKDIQIVQSVNENPGEVDCDSEYSDITNENDLKMESNISKGKFSNKKQRREKALVRIKQVVCKAISEVQRSQSDFK